MKSTPLFIRPTKLTWTTKVHDFNRNIIEDYDIMGYAAPIVKRLKRSCADFAAFSEQLRREMMYQFWSRCEYETVLVKKPDGRFFLYPFIARPGQENPLEVTDDTTFDWAALMNGFKYCRECEDGCFEVKIDVYDQLMLRWNDFARYCWGTTLKYERDNEKFHKFELPERASKPNERN